MKPGDPEFTDEKGNAVRAFPLAGTPLWVCTWGSFDGKCACALFDDEHFRERFTAHNPSAVDLLKKLK